MPSTNRKISKIVVRPLARSTRSADKVVLGTLGELNGHAPVDDGRQKLEPKPWKQASRSYPRFRAGKVVTRRNAGRDDERTWMTSRYVCGAGLEAEWSDECGGDEQDGRELLVEDEGKHDGRAEVAIMDIAKPMKLRGPSREYEVVDTVRRVIVLEDEDGWEWDGDTELGREDDRWETVEDMASSRLSYAMILQRQIS
ncbi:hypothetical protein LXA43DRAFT_309408 [Ganoderma leucocontextum]|nr:hypothetical protein LXA43DRAFT_309408 [Ganoderma leucocontextum]